MIGLGAYRAIREYIKYRRQRVVEDAFRRGYDYAAGALLRGDKPLEELQTECDREPWHPFDKGMIAAITDYLHLLNGTNSILGHLDMLNEKLHSNPDRSGS